MNNMTEDPWYVYFNADGIPSLCLLGVFTLRALLATVGIIFNAAIVYITAKESSLHGVCNMLIALESLFAIFQDASYFVSFVVFATSVKFIHYRTCFPMLVLLGSVCGNNAQLAMVFTGADRLLCILFPIWYKTRNRCHYLLFVGAAFFAYGTYQFCLQIIAYKEARDYLLSCSTHDMTAGSTGFVATVSGLTLSGTLMAEYALIWMLVFVKLPIVKAVSDNQKRLLKSLMLIICANMFGVFIKSAMSWVFSNVWRVDVFIKNGYLIAMSFLTIAVYSANAPVLYTLSKQYRDKFNKHFKWLRWVFNSKQFQQVSVLQQQHHHLHNAPQSFATMNNNNYYVHS